MLKSDDNLLDSSINQSFDSNMTVRLANAVQKHTSLQTKWLEQIERITKKRAQDNISLTKTKRMMNRSLQNSPIGSLIERQNTF